MEKIASKSYDLVFLYDSEKEKEAHKKEMENLGYIDSGERITDLNYQIGHSEIPPDYHWCGKYMKSSK